MKTKHTAGPWAVGKWEGLEGNEIPILGPKDDQWICDVIDHQAAGSIEEQAANAKLIASSPKLLSKLIELSNGMTVSGRKHYGLEELIKEATA